MAIEGPLRELGIHDVFQLLDLSRKTGVLRVTSEVRHNAGTIHFEDGTVVYAEIRSNPHPLGSLLLRTGKSAEADLERARDMQQRQGDKRRLGEILVALGAITPRELERQLRFQVEEVIFEVMSWREGYFSFVEGPLLDVPPAATVRIPTEALLMEGARRIDEWSRIESRIPHLGVIAAPAPPPSDGGGELGPLPPQWERRRGPRRARGPGRGGARPQGPGGGPRSGRAGGEPVSARPRRAPAVGPGAPRRRPCGRGRGRAAPRADARPAARGRAPLPRVRPGRDRAFCRSGRAVEPVGAPRRAVGDGGRAAGRSATRQDRGANARGQRSGVPWLTRSRRSRPSWRAIRRASCSCGSPICCDSGGSSTPLTGSR